MQTKEEFKQEFINNASTPQVVIEAFENETLKIVEYKHKKEPFWTVIGAYVEPNGLIKGYLP